MIREILKVATNRQKSYADIKRKDVRYEIGENVFLKVSPRKEVMRFGRKGKLSPKFIGPYEMIEKVGPVAYRLALPLELEKIHNVFHVSMLRRCRSDSSHARFEKSKISADISCIDECRHDISFRLSVIGNFGFLSVFSAKFQLYIGFLPIFSSVTVHESVLFTTVHKSATVHHCT